MSTIKCATLAALAALAAASTASSQTPAQSGDGSLVFNPDMRQWAFRAAGVPWFCVADARCVQIRFDGVAPGQLAGAEITALGFAGGTYYLAVRHADIAGGRQQAFRCAAESCAPSDMPAGDFAFLGTHSLMLQGRLQSRTAILARAADAPERSRLMWCSDRACTEQAFTRDNRYDLAFMGVAPMDGRTRIWLRERSGTVFGCAPAEAAGDDRIDCTPTSMVFPDVAGPTAADPSEPSLQAMVAAVEAAIRRGNWAEADRLIAEGRSRFPSQPQWAQFAQRLAQLRADRDSRARIDQARRLVIDARRYANAGDYRAAQAVLEEAARLAPGLADIAQARAEISRLRAERFQRFRERSQFVAAIEQALGAFRLWEADGLIGEALVRFPNDPEFRNFERRADQLRAQAEWQGRLRRAQQFVAAARAAMGREQFGEAERQLDAAEALAMGLPEIRAARAELARLRIEADSRNAEIRQITVDIEALLADNNFVGAERMLDFAMRRHPSHPGWGDLRRRIDQAKSSTGIRQFIADARAAMAKKDWAEANRQIARAEAVDRTAPAVIAARKALDDARRDASLQAQKFIAAGDAAVKAKNWPAAEKAADDAAAADPFNPTVQAAVRKLKADIAAGKGAGPGAVAPLLAAADAQIAKKNWPEAAKEIAKAEAIDAKSPAVIAARKRLEDARQAAAQEAKKFIAAGEAAAKAKNWPAAEKAAADAAAADPFDPAVQAEVKKLRDEIALGKGAGPGLGAIAPLIALADAQIAKKNWPEAAKEIAKAEAIDAKSPAVIAARKRLEDARQAAVQEAKKFIAAGEAAAKAKNWPAAEKAAADAAAADPFNPAVQAEVKKLRDEIALGKGAGPGPGTIAPLIAAADAQIAKKNWPEAAKEIAKAEAIDAKSPAVIAARKRLDDARRDAFNKAQPFAKAAEDAIHKGNRAVADKNVAQVKLIDPFGPALKILAAEYKKRGW